ncbi:SRA stem-loop-interacting RNA-binding protein, mitochondrial-like [Asterias amurensis]|uniref:SRA stem-loop-interacting RNA-binding protein, mitochondrial-like n=1 Tax=Asterias amurensis TaxID=7602 RepID=UPI003AB507A9
MAARAAARRVHELFVSKLPWTAGANEIREHFAQFGPVRACRVTFDQNTGFSKGFAFVTYQSEEAVKRALQMDSHQIDGQKIAVYKRQGSSTSGVSAVNRLQISDVFNHDSDSETA